MQCKFPVHVTFPFIAHAQPPHASWLCHTPQGWSWDDEHGCLSGGSLLIIITLRRHRLGNCTLLCHLGIFEILASCGMADEVRIQLWLQKRAGMLWNIYRLFALCVASDLFQNNSCFCQSHEENMTSHPLRIGFRCLHIVASSWCRGNVFSHARWKAVKWKYEKLKCVALNSRSWV